MFKSLFLPLIAVAGFIVFVGLLTQGKLEFLTSRMPTDSNFKIIKVNNTEIKIEVAKTNEEKSKGLSNRESLGEKNGMVFIFDKGSMPTFWMKDTKIALDLIWIKDNKIIGIDKNVQPESNINDADLKKYSAPSSIDYVLEVNGGFSDKFNLQPDEMISGLEQL